MIELWHWRRTVADLYACVRAAPDPQAAWHDWRRGRDALFRSHPQSPLEADRRAGFTAFGQEAVYRVPLSPPEPAGAAGPG